MDTSRIDGVEAPQHFKTPRSHVVLAGAASFVDFMVSFMVGLSITMIDRLYLGPAVDTGAEIFKRPSIFGLLWSE